MCLALGVFPLDPALYYDRECTLGTILGPCKGCCPLILLVVAAPRSPPSNLKTKEETSGEITPTKCDVLIPSIPNECILKDIDLPLLEVCTNDIFMSNQENIIDEFLEQCDFDDENINICCSNFYRKGN